MFQIIGFYLNNIFKFIVCNFLQNQFRVSTLLISNAATLSLTLCPVHTTGDMSCS